MNAAPGSWPGFDAAGLAADRLVAARRRRMLIRGASLAAAAGLALAVVIAPWASRPGPVQVIATGVAGDLNGDGRVDMLDALMLARAVDDARARREWDFTGDGSVDRADVDRLALGAVRLNGGGL